jgi:hypothetical protein
MVAIHLAVARKCFVGLLAMLAYPLAQYILVHIQILGGLAHRDTTLLNQLHSLKLELATELPSCCH